MYRFLLLLVGLCGWGSLRAETVLVLPFVDQTKSPNLEWIGESVAETIRESLASEGALVLSREDRLEAYRRLSLRPTAELTHASMIKLGQALDAAKVVYGYYTLREAKAAPSGSGAEAAPSRGSIRITARILDIRHMRQGPEFAEIGALEDLAALETHLGWQALQFLTPKLAPSEQEFLKARPTVRIDAVESYIRGLLASTPEEKNRLFAQAARLDERYSQPCFQLGKLYWQRKDWAVAARWLQRVLHSDSHYLEAQFFLGLCRYYMGDFTAAQASFQTVASQVPLNEVFNNLGAAQARLSLPEARVNLQKALEGDRSDPDYYFNLGYELWREGTFTAAAERFRAALERSPSDAEAQLFLERCEKQEGPRPGDPKSAGRERLKTNYEETAYRQLKAELESRR